MLPVLLAQAEATVEAMPSVDWSAIPSSAYAAAAAAVVGGAAAIGIGAMIVRSVPDHSRVFSPRPSVLINYPSRDPAEPGSDRHIYDPYSIWS